MNRLFRKFTPLILIAATVIFTLLGIKGIKDRKAFTQTTATISSITCDDAVGDEDSNYRVMVKYSVDGKEYESELGEYSSNMKEGKEIEIKYNPKNPNEIITAGSFSVIMYFGLAFISLISFFVVILKRIR